MVTGCLITVDDKEFHLHTCQLKLNCPRVVYIIISISFNIKIPFLTFRSSQKLSGLRLKATNLECFVIKLLYTRIEPDLKWPKNTAMVRNTNISGVFCGSGWVANPNCTLPKTNNSFLFLLHESGSIHHAGQCMEFPSTAKEKNEVAIYFLHGER